MPKKQLCLGGFVATKLHIAKRSRDAVLAPLSLQTGSKIIVGTNNLATTRDHMVECLLVTSMNLMTSFQSPPSPCKAHPMPPELLHRPKLGEKGSQSLPVGAVSPWWHPWHPITTWFLTCLMTKKQLCQGGFIATKLHVVKRTKNAVLAPFHLRPGKKLRQD